MRQRMKYLLAAMFLGAVITACPLAAKRAAARPVQLRPQTVRLHVSFKGDWLALGFVNGSIVIDPAKSYLGRDQDLPWSKDYNVLVVTPLNGLHYWGFREKNLGVSTTGVGFEGDLKV